MMIARLWCGVVGHQWSSGHHVGWTPIRQCARCRRQEALTREGWWQYDHCEVIGEEFALIRGANDKEAT